ncbi:YlxM family DNA-binding protein [Fundicoccus sp. Sow4_H7]|uniref:YlxM family DNA-binding protein n=1 Tax=Fundicoccus sp. Sow4_H7 TaxID=3438784 RepID=UPI003F8ECFB8
MLVEKTVYFGRLFSLYKPLLTTRQQEMLSLYYEEDFSLSEIAEQFEISRQGVLDTIRRGEKLLENYEDALHMNANRLKRIELLEELQSMSEDKQMIELVKQLRNLDE